MSFYCAFLCHRWQLFFWHWDGVFGGEAMPTYSPSHLGGPIRGLGGAAHSTTFPGGGCQMVPSPGGRRTMERPVLVCVSVPCHCLGIPPAGRLGVGVHWVAGWLSDSWFHPYAVPLLLVCINKVGLWPSSFQQKSVRVVSSAQCYPTTCFEPTIPICGKEIF